MAERISNLRKMGREREVGVGRLGDGGPCLGQEQGQRGDDSLRQVCLRILQCHIKTLQCHISLQCHIKTLMSQCLCHST